jgi:hypothetical protein
MEWKDEVNENEKSCSWIWLSKRGKVEDVGERWSLGTGREKSSEMHREEGTCSIY